MVKKKTTTSVIDEFDSKENVMAEMHAPMDDLRR